MEIELLRHQWQAMHSPAKNTLLLGGVGSGKTFTGCCFVYKQICEQPGTTGLVFANSYQQLRDVVIEELLKFFDLLKIKYTYNKVDSIIRVLKTDNKIICRSVENYDKAIRGIEIGWYWGDEVAYAKREAFDVILGRLRDKNAVRHHGLLTTTPKGYNWLYDYFHPSGELHSPDYAMVNAASSTNKHLPDGYVDSLKGQYDSKLYQQEILGEFVSLQSDTTYWAFDRDKHVKSFTPAKGTYDVGMDFNISPFSAVVGYMVNGVIYIHDEIFKMNATTPQVASELYAKHGKCTIIPDSTGASRKTSGKTDFMMLKEAGHTIQSTRNPFVIDRVNNVNRLLDKGRIIIHPSCKNLIADLQKVVWDKYGNLDQKTDKMRTHITDAFGYMCNLRAPMREDVGKVYSTWR